MKVWRGRGGEDAYIKPYPHHSLSHFQVSAYMRLAQKTTGGECRALADAVIDLLGMRHICNSEVRGFRA